MSTQRGIDVSTVKTFLNELREGHIFIARITSGGRGGKYSYLIPPVELLKLLGVGPGARFEVRIDKERGFVDYLIDDKGSYKLAPSGRAAQIRFPLDNIRGYVVVEPLDKKGFRVYF